MKHTYKKHLLFLVTLAGGLILSYFLVDTFLELREELNEKDLASFDDSVADLAMQIRSAPLTGFFKIVSFFGDQTFYLIALPIMAFFIYRAYGKFNVAIQAAVVLSIVALTNNLLKELIERPRPAVPHLVEASSSSFPSGHVVTSVAFFGFLIYIFWRSDLKRIIKLLLTIALGVIIFLIGTSRIYLGVHYASDVIAGIIAGGFFLLVFILAFYVQRYIKNNNHRQGNQTP